MSKSIQEPDETIVMSLSLDISLYSQSIKIQD